MPQPVAKQRVGSSPLPPERRNRRNWLAAAVLLERCSFTAAAPPARGHLPREERCSFTAAAPPARGHLPREERVQATFCGHCSTDTLRALHPESEFKPYATCSQKKLAATGGRMAAPSRDRRERFHLSRHATAASASIRAARCAPPAASATAATAPRAAIAATVARPSALPAAAAAPCTARSDA
eukprot:361994-Chlamydomonas_euryale.AAC.1